MEIDFSYQRAAMQDAIWEVAASMQRPSVLFRPAISMDGNMWCALYGDNLQDGVAGFGASVAEAMADFDKNWNSDQAHKIKTEEINEQRRNNGQFGVGA